MSGLRAQIKEILKENSSDDMNFKTNFYEPERYSLQENIKRQVAAKFCHDKFWEAIDAHNVEFEAGNHQDAQDQAKIAQIHARMHKRKTGKRIHVERKDLDRIGEFESRYVTRAVKLSGK